MDILGTLLPSDPRVALLNAEEKFIGRKIRPSELRKMAASVREDAKRLDEMAARAHNRADVYEDIATEREAGA